MEGNTEDGTERASVKRMRLIPLYFQADQKCTIFTPCMCKFYLQMRSPPCPERQWELKR